MPHNNEMKPTKPASERLQQPVAMARSSRLISVLARPAGLIEAGRAGH
jgi:hypothetical protein